MNQGNYWTRRVSRRSALRGAGLGIAGVAGVALIGCGGGDEGTPAATATSLPSPTATPDTAATQAAAEESGILTKRVDTTAQAVPGGVLPSYTGADPESGDPLGGTSFTSQFYGRIVYPTLLEFKAGIVDPATGDVQGQLAESWEQPEPTRLILHLRSDAKWDQRAPTSSRPVDAEDVVFSWNKFSEKSISRKSLANTQNESAPITSMEAVDDHTIEVKTAFPYGPLLQALAYTRWFQIMPRESDGGFDPRSDLRGAGPWMVTKAEPSVRYEYRKNPNYWKKDVPFLDGFDRPVIAEYAQQLAQFVAGNIYGGVVRQEDVISTKKDIPELDVYQGEFTRGNWKLYFSLRPDSPFVDARVRRAVSMLIDRDLTIETFSNTKEFSDEGWPVETRWHSIGISAGYDGIWLDPRTNALGDGAANFAFNPDEAAKLMDAAGVPKPLETPLSFISTLQYGSTFPRVGEAYKGMLEASGLFKIEQRNPDYQTEYLPNIYFGKGDFEGIAWGATTIFPVPVQHLVDYYTSTGAREKVAFKGDPNSVEGQAEAEAIVEKAVRSLDFEETVSLIQDWQRHEALRMPDVPSPWPYGTAGFGLYWPWAKNVGTYRDYLESGETVALPYWWIDESLRKA